MAVPVPVLVVDGDSDDVAAAVAEFVVDNVSAAEAVPVPDNVDAEDAVIDDVSDADGDPEPPTLKAWVEIMRTRRALVDNPKPLLCRRITAGFSDMVTLMVEPTHAINTDL